MNMSSVIELVRYECNYNQVIATAISQLRQLQRNNENISGDIEDVIQSLNAALIEQTGRRKNYERS